MINNNDNFRGEMNGTNKVKGEETINLPHGVRVEFKGYYNNNKPYNGTIKKYDNDNNLIMEGGFLCINGNPTYDERNYHGKITEYRRNGNIQHTGTYEQFGGGRIIPIGEHMYYYPNGIIKRTEAYNKYGKLDGDVEAYDNAGNLEFHGTFNNGAGNGTYYYPDETVKRTEAYNENGELDGDVEAYDNAGNLEFRGTFNNGVGHGTYYYNDLQNVRHTLYEGDVGFSEGSETYFGHFIATMHDIYPHGNGRVYDGHDILRFEGRYWNGKRNGLVKEYNMNNGRLKSVGEYKDNIRNGIIRKYHDNGQLMCVEEYKDNELHGSVIQYHDNGKLKFEGKYSNDKPDGMIRQYNDNGKLIFEGKYINGNRNGSVKEYNDNGNLMHVSEYKDNMRHGSVKEYHDNGRLKFEGEYVKGKLNGHVKKYDANGKVIFEGKYKDNKGHGKECDANGKVIFEGEYYDYWRDGHGKEYDANNKVRFEGEYRYGRRDHGKEYDANNKVIFEGRYSSKGEQDDGKRYTYNSEGQLIKTETIENGKVVQQNNEISHENKFNLGSQNNELGKK